MAPIEPTQRRAWLTNTQHDRPVNSADPLFPLASNREQRRVQAKLSDDTTVVVQGPPGTGKTHTIANPICALLADGQRLLITSQKDQALRVLREKLPKEVRRLCVLMTGMQRTETDGLDRSITALLELSSTVTADELGREITKLRDQRSDLTTALQQAIFQVGLRYPSSYPRKRRAHRRSSGPAGTTGDSINPRSSPGHVQFGRPRRPSTEEAAVHNYTGLVAAGFVVINACRFHAFRLGGLSAGSPPISDQIRPKRR